MEKNHTILLYSLFICRGTWIVLSACSLTGQRPEISPIAKQLQSGADGIHEVILNTETAI